MHRYHRTALPLIGVVWATLALVGAGCGVGRTRAASWQAIANRKAADLVEVEVGGEFWATAPTGRPDAVVIRDRKQLDAFMRVFGHAENRLRLSSLFEQGGPTWIVFRFRDGTVADGSMHYPWLNLDDDIDGILWPYSELARDVDGLRRTARAVRPEQVVSVEFIRGTNMLAKLDGALHAAAVRKLWTGYRNAEPFGPAFWDEGDSIVVTFRKNGEDERTTIKVDFRQMRRQYSPEVEKVTVGIIEGMSER